jgi:hypothetical protein
MIIIFPYDAHADTTDQDILPKEEGLTKKDFGQCATRSDGVI